MLLGGSNLAVRVNVTVTSSHDQYHRTADRAIDGLHISNVYYNSCYDSGRVSDSTVWLMVDMSIYKPEYIYRVILANRGDKYGWCLV